MAGADKGAATSPFETVIMRLAQDGLNLKKSIDVLSLTEASRLVNVVPVMGGQLLTRPGMTSLATASGSQHSIARLNDPQGGTFTRFVGAGSGLFRGQSGALNNVDSGYSGNPLALVPFRPPLSGASYMFVGDSSRMSKISRTAARLPIGLPKPATVSTAIAATYKTQISTFSVSDGTNAAAWTKTAGQDTSSPPVAANPPTLTDDAVNPGVIMHVDPGAAAAGYSSIIGIAKALDLSVLNGGSVAATDNDEVAITILANVPGSIVEIRVYLVCSAAFSASIIPGTDQTNNTDAFVKAFRPNDFQSFVSLISNSALTAQDALRTNALIDQFSTDNSNDSPAPGQASAPFPSAKLGLGAQARSMFGTIGLPLRRLDFARIGGNNAYGWNTISGIIITVQMASNTTTDIGFYSCYLTGGAGIDSAEPGDIPFDYRATNYDPRTGAESNPSDVQADSAKLDSNRQPINVTVAAYGDPNIRQRFYRRGGTLTNDWFFCGTNTSDGGAFLDGIDTTVTPNIAKNTDATIEAAGAVEIDNDQPVSSVDANGNAVTAQPLRALWGPVAAMLIGCGDPYRPGAVYWSKPGMPDSWPSANWVEVTAPSEELMNGCVFGGQAFVFSRDRGYLLSTSLAGAATGFVATPTDCTPGLATYWGLCVGPDGIYYVAKDGLRATKGGESVIVSDQIRPLFNGQARNGLNPIDFTAASSIRLTSFNNDIWFTYRDVVGATIVLVYSVIYRIWRQVSFATTPVSFYADPTQGDAGLLLLIGSSGTLFTHSGTTDNGTPFSCQVRTGALDFGYTRGNTLFGDLIVDADMQGNTLSAQVLLNNETISNSASTVTPASGRKRIVFDTFGAGTNSTTPQQGRNVSVDLQWTPASGTSPVIELAGISIIPQPNVTMNRVTAWDTPGDAEVYLTGMWIDCDTGTSSRTVHVEYDLNGAIAEVSGSPFTVNPSGLAGRHKWWFSWPVAKANMVRLRPDDGCVPWELYSYSWLAAKEPPRIATWDTNYENKQNAYYTGVNIECDTFGLTKTIQFYVDQTLISTQTISANGRQLLQLTLPTARGSVFRFVATDANPGLLYSWNWMSDPEPGTQSNWNQNYTIGGTLSDKWVKGALLECDTFGQDKTVTFEVDGSVVATQTVNTSGRKVVEVSFTQALGRVLRMIPTDSHPGRLYSMEWIFDEEPLALSRWETQELDLEISGWKVLPTAWITLKSTAQVTLTTTVYGQNGTVIATLTNNIPSTGGVKQKVYVPFAPNKGMLYKFVWTSASAFWLYREESLVYCREWGADKTVPKQPFGNDDFSPRGMHHSQLTSARSGGGSAVL